MGQLLLSYTVVRFRYARNTRECVRVSTQRNCVANGIFEACGLEEGDELPVVRFAGRSH